MELQEKAILIMELIGTVAFAASGAMVGIRRQMDLFGVMVLGVVTAVGGGLVRDLILGQIPPVMFQDKIYAETAILTSLIVFFSLFIHQKAFFVNLRQMGDRVMLVMDSIGLGIFTVVGVYSGIQHGFGGNLFFLVFLGTITGVGGGLLRDVMAGVPPYILVKHIYACASIVGAIVCAYSYPAFGEVCSMIISCLVVIVIRGLAAHYRWDLPKVPLG